MSHYAKIEDGIVTQVIVAERDFIDSGAVGDASNWVQTSYNTRGGVHYAPNSDTPDGGVALRKNYAGKGYTYDKTKDAFIAPQPYPSWSLDEDTCQWNPPTPYPDDDTDAELAFIDSGAEGHYHGKFYIWDEDNTQWI